MFPLGPKTIIRYSSQIKYCLAYDLFSLSMAMQPLCTLAGFSESSSSTQSVGLLGRAISPSQGRYLHTQ
jgi:hypothetical protein